MSDMMTFPETWEEFEKSYGFDDSEEIYTNGSRLIPSFRVKQWIDHEESKRATVSSECISRQDAVDVLLTGKEFLMRVLDDADVVGQDREKYSWGLGLIESCINDVEELPSAELELSNNSPKLDNENGDLISRKDAIDALNACCVKYDISPNYDDKRTDKEKFYDWWDMHKVLSMRTINDLPSAEPEIIRCINCKHRDSNDCPMYYEEWIEIDEGDGYFDTDTIIHDPTTDEGFCHCAELRGKDE